METSMSNETKIPAAQDFISQSMWKAHEDGPLGAYEKGDVIVEEEKLLEKLIEFAKLHVKAALEAAAENVSVERCGQYTEGDGFNCDASVNKQSILNAYPDELIK